MDLNNNQTIINKMKHTENNEPKSQWCTFITESKGYNLMYNGKHCEKWRAFVSGYTDFDSILKGKEKVKAVVNPESLLWKERAIVQ